MLLQDVQRARVTKPMDRINVRHVYLCESPLSHNKVKHPGLDCVQRKQTVHNCLTCNKLKVHLAGGSCLDK